MSEVRTQTLTTAEIKKMNKAELVKELMSLYCGDEKKEITSASDVAPIIRGMITKAQQEHFFAMYLDGAHKIIKTEMIFLGTLNHTIIHPREVFAPAVELRAAGIIIAHNHPSGTLRPSEEDKIVTDRLKLAGEILGIEILDHVIITPDAHWSFKGNKLI